MAQIKKLAEGKYLIRVSKGTGTRREQPSATFRGTLKDAKAEAREMETLIGGHGKLAFLKFETYLDVWLKAIASKVAPRTKDGYKEYIHRYALTALTGLKVGKINEGHIQEIYDACGKSSTTVRNLHASLNACFAWAVKKKSLKSNPCQNTDRPIKVRPKILVMSKAEASIFADLCRDYNNGVIFEFGLETGMRPEEYLALRWRDISGNEVSVVQAVQFRRKGGGYDFKDIKTPKGRRRIPISERLRLRLITHRRQQNEHRLALKGTWFNHDLVFTNEIGRPFAINNITRRYLKPILDKCEFDQHHTLYSLRHTMATLLLLANVHPKIVSERLGHSSVVITLDTYSHVMPHIQNEATETMDDIMRRKA